MTTKIDRNHVSINSARKILDFLRFQDNGMSDAVVSIDENGTLLCYNRACGIEDGETVIVERLEPDTFGGDFDSWVAMTSGELIGWIESEFLNDE